MDVISHFLRLFKANEHYKQIMSSMEGQTLHITGLTDTAKPHFLYGLFSEQKKSILTVVSSATYAKRLIKMLSFFDIDAVYFPEREYNFYNMDAQSDTFFRERLNALNSALNGDKRIYVTTLPAATELVLPMRTLERSILKISEGAVVSLAEISEKLVYLGYKFEDMVEFPGQFSVRGGILDVFTYTADNPYRIELFGDEIDSIRMFDPRSQLSYEKLQSADISAASEIVYSKEQSEELIKKLRNAKRSAKAQELKDNLEADIEKIKNEGIFHGLDKYIGLIYEDTPTFLDYFNPRDTLIIYEEPQRISEVGESLRIRRGEMISALMEKQILIDTPKLYEDTQVWIDKTAEYTRMGICNILTSQTLYHPDSIVSVTSADTPTYYGKLNLFADDVSAYEKKGYTVVIPAGHSKITNFHSYLVSAGIIPKMIKSTSAIKTPGVYLLEKSGVMGFVYPEQMFILMYDASIFGEYKKPQKRKKTTESLLSFSDLKIGDYVVHNVHGIGQYTGNEKLIIEGVKRDYLKIRYHGTDVLYIPASQLDSLNKYIGAGEATVRVNRLGGQEFARVKARARAACSDLADKLISLYAEREKLVGHAYAPDSDMQSLFEQTFPYEETQDQIVSISEVKADMESIRPMDRLLCGDVGYGKTEVAMRAAFKCAAEGKQTAYLASTTVLAQQHYSTFQNRMENFPVSVEMLSRFRTKKQQEAILKRVKSGAVDILIGTHRILSKDVQFKDLGLLIVDEEQRFGVEHKERLKELKKNVEVLTLTATPIPRTLHMSMLGIRDMSVLKEPPSNRLPVQTFVLEYNENIIKDAIEKELTREGQVFYLFNRVDGINRVAARLREMFPEASVAVANGQMSERLIENTFIKMLNHEIDILVCTTIIETGIDIGNANTIIVEDSDRLGLSQLYQIRGRVGRSKRLAYCYLTYRKNKALSEQSENRLKAIKEFTEFGSGFKIALRDLEIRGAGNVLGAEQHGHMDAVGYDMYLKILESALKEKKGEAEPEEINCRADIKVNAYIPDSYIKNHEIRMEIYKQIAAIKTSGEASDIIDELIDRFAEIPAPVMNLITTAHIKALAESSGIVDISDTMGIVTFSYKDAGQLKLDKILDIASAYKNLIVINAGNTPGFQYKIPKGDMENKLDNIKNILQMLN